MAYQTSKTTSSLLRTGQIFVRCEIWQICQFTRHDLKENVKKIWSLNLVGEFQSEACQNYFIFVLQSNGEGGKFVSQYAAWRSLLRIQLLLFPSLHSSFISTAKYCSIFTSLCKPTKYTSVHKPPESAKYTDVQVKSWLIKLIAAKLRIQEQTRAEKWEKV